MYEIRPESVKTFVEDRKINFPRFQRRQAWDAKQNFKLCISIFKNYPIGVTVLNKEEVRSRSTKWLLDGRQRRNALIAMLENPELIYDWARKFVGIKGSDQPDVIEENFWKAIQKHLEEDEENNKYDNDNSNSSEDYNNEESEIDETDEISFNSESTEDDANGDDSPELEYDVNLDHDDKDKDLKLLLKLILMVHNRTKVSSGLTRPFDFSKYIDNLEYIDVVGHSKIHNGRKLRSFIKEFKINCYNDDVENPTKEYFTNYIVTKYKVPDNKKGKLSTLVDQKWDRISERIQMIEHIENKMHDTIIGLIELKNASSTDAQNIFKLINSEGTQLTAEEILSAKPSWNVILKNPSSELESEVKQLYKQLSIKTNDVVKWDFPATLIGRLNYLRMVFKNLSYSNDKEFKSRVTLGFKLMGALFEKGINKVEVAKLAGNPEIGWKEDLEQLVQDLNTVGKLLLDHCFFKFFSSWKISLMELTSDTVALNFIALCYFDWKRKGSLIGNNNTVKKFQKNSLILFDKMIYEYVSKQWRGSSDSRVAENIRSFAASPDILTPVSSDKWETLLKEIFTENTLMGDPIKAQTLRPILYHYYCLNNVSGPDGIDTEVHIDHIIPQSLYDQSALTNRSTLKHNLFNLSLLPRKENITKKDKRLNNIDDPWLIQQIIKYTNIPRDEFDKYSNLNNYTDLKIFRETLYKDTFTNIRTNLLVN